MSRRFNIIYERDPWVSFSSVTSNEYDVSEKKVSRVHGEKLGLTAIN
jgi:hypothetical protein